MWIFQAPNPPRSGEILKGRVSAVKSFGAFVTLPDNQTGMVHISELSRGYVEKAEDFVAVGDDVTVKVLGADGGKIKLSMRACEETKPAASFEEMLSSYKKRSDERQHELKSYEKSKRKR